MDNQEDNQVPDLSRYYGSSQSEPVFSRREERPQKKSKLTKWIIKVSGGLIEDEKTAGYAALAMSIAIIIISLFILVSSGTPDAPDPNEIIEVAGPAAGDSR